MVDSKTGEPWEGEGVREPAGEATGEESIEAKHEPGGVEAHRGLVVVGVGVRASCRFRPAKPRAVLVLLPSSTVEEEEGTDAAGAETSPLPQQYR